MAGSLLSGSVGWFATQCKMEKCNANEVGPTIPLFPRAENFLRLSLQLKRKTNFIRFYVIFHSHFRNESHPLIDGQMIFPNWMFSIHVPPISFIIASQVRALFIYRSFRLVKFCLQLFLRFELMTQKAKTNSECAVIRKKISVRRSTNYSFRTLANISFFVSAFGPNLVECQLSTPSFAFHRLVNGNLC